MWTKVVNNIIFERHDHCRLCFGEVDVDDLGFHDEVLLNLNEEKISNMLLYILGGKYTSDMNVDDKFCSTCVMSVKNAYNFIKMCKDKTDSLENIIESLNESLRQTKGIKRTKSVLLYIDSTDFSFMQFYQYRESVRPPAQRKFDQSISNNLIENKYAPKAQDVIKSPRHKTQDDEPMKQDKSHKTSTGSKNNTTSNAGTLTNQQHTANEENKNANSVLTQDKDNLEKQPYNLKAVIQNTISAGTRSRKHILKLNTSTSKAAFLNLKAGSQKTQTDSQEPQKNSNLRERITDIVKDSYTHGKANILHKSRKVFKCTACGRRFDNKQNLMKHIKNLCMYSCKYCKMEFTNYKLLLRHTKREQICRNYT